MFSPTDICVIVHRGRNLIQKGKNGNDAYATMEFEGDKYATNVVEKSLSPSWHQECQFRLPQGGVLHNSLITITVYNKHHGKLGLQNDDFIGTVKLPLSTLDTTSHKEYKRWYSLEHKNPKKEKKQRGDVEVGLRFLSRNRTSILPDKKSPKTFTSITTKLGGKLRRRSEDEDSGLGSENSTMRRGMSMDNLHRSPSTASDGIGRKKRFSIVEAGSGVSARGLIKLSNKIGLSGGKSKATSIEVLNSPEIKKHSSSSNLRRSGSSASALTVKKQHVRNRSMPDTSLLALTQQRSPRNSICINGPHIYISGTDSGNNSPSASLENVDKNESSEDVRLPEVESMDQLHASHNENFSNSKPLNPFDEPKPSSLSIVYKPKAYYRLGVKELCKVSPIPEDPTITFQQMDRDQLFKLCVKQHGTLAQKSQQICELEDYIDTLLLKVMVCTPQILDRSPKTAILKTKF